MSRWLALAVPIVAGVAAGGLLWAARGLAPAGCERYVDLTLGALDHAGRCVRIRGTGHFGAAIVFPVDRPWPAADDTAFLVPVFPQGDVTGREITLFVRSARTPSDLVEFEDMVVEGRLERASVGTVPAGTTEQLESVGYFLADPPYVLLADRIEGGEGAWPTDKPAVSP